MHKVVNLYFFDEELDVENFNSHLDSPYEDDTKRLSFADVGLMQYTGLKDKNGKEIYEGDIVDFASRFDNSKRTGKVVYYAGDAAFLIEDGKEIFFLFYDALEREVIGNIYENPELLKDNK